jgi:hypothetical protein
LLSFSLALDDRRAVRIDGGASSIFVPPHDAAVYVMGFSNSSWHLSRLDPVSLARTGRWREPLVDLPRNVVWSSGLFWTVVQRNTSAGSRFDLVSLDPQHPGHGWQNRGTTESGCDYLVASAAGRWLACVLAGTFGSVYLYHIGLDGAPKLINTSRDIEDLISGPSFAPDGSTAVINEPTQPSPYDPVEDGFYTANTSDLGTETNRWIEQENYSSASYTPDGTRILAFDHYGYSFSFDPTNPAAPPEQGAYIPYDPPGDYGIHGVGPTCQPAFAHEHPYVYVLAHLNYSGPSTGSTWNYHLARYPLPTS